MCSINGFNFSNRDLIEKMVKATKHRGPDDQGFFIDQNVSLGHARLSIIDLSEKGRQPLWNEDKTIAVICNGEIYNFRQLRRELEKEGHLFFSGSDSEVIVHLYEDKKEKTPQFLNGIFAFAVYNKKENCLFLARDGQGVKPLYYYFDNQRLIFSSEIKGLLVHPIKRELNSQALEHHFRLFFTPSPFTLLKGIYKLQPAHYLKLEPGGLEIKRYWHLEDKEEIKSKKQAVLRIKEQFKEAVKAQLVSDRPLGIFLSGGVDSTAVLGQASKLTSGKIKTFSVGYQMEVKDEKFNQDFYLAQKTAQVYATDHHQLLISDKQALDNFEQVLEHLEEPAPNPVQIATFLLAKEAKSKVAVVLGGDGGDEIFGGYPRYYYDKLINLYQKAPLFLRKGLLSSLAEKALNKEQLSEKLATPGPGRYLLYLGANTNDLAKVFRPEIFSQFKNDTEDFLARNYPPYQFKDPLKYLMYLDLNTWLSDKSLLRSDKMTMAWGLEQRVPLLDHHLIELAFQIPSRFKIKKGLKNKWIFRQAVKEFLPPHLLKQEKMGFASPGAKWLRGGFEDFAKQVLSENYCRGTRPLFNFPQIQQMLSDHIQGKAYHYHILWALLCFQIWHRQFIDN